MRLRPHHHRNAQTFVLIVIVLAIVGGGVAYLWWSKENNEKSARDFAQEAAERILRQHDEHFLDVRLSPDAQVEYPPSWRSRLFSHLYELGQPEQNLDLTGETTFQSFFFEPKGMFRVRGQYPQNPAPAILALGISHPRALWQIDYINLIWTPLRPAPAPTPPPNEQLPPSP